MRIRFGSFEIDEERLLLTRDGIEIALRPKVFDLLLVLVRERSRVVRREELFERLWSSTTVGFGSLSGLVNELRSALGESGRGPSSIRTVHARGYQFVASAIELADEDAAVASRRASIAEWEEGSSGGVGDDDPIGAARSGEGPGRSVTGLGDPSVIGARACVACLPGETERVAWLSQRAAEARSAGYRLRFATARGGTGDEARGPGRQGDAAPDSGPHGDAPIALLLDVADPAAWHRAGGLRRLLDLFGRMPVLVLAAIAAAPADPVVGALLGADERIDRFDAASSSARSSSRLGDVPGPALDPADETAALERTLRGLARSGGPCFEAALRSLGFAAIRPEPIRSLRRVEPPGAGAPAPRRAEALAGWSAEAAFAGYGDESGPDVQREPETRRRGP